MRTLPKKAFLCSLLCLLPLLLSGCFLRLLFGTVGERDTEFGTVFIATIGGTWGPMAICDFDESDTLVECTYSFLDFEAEEPVVERTSSAQLISELGILGVFIDPLILQVPAGATNFMGTITDSAGLHPIAITEVGSFQVQPGVEVFPEAGQQFVILEFPPNVITALTAAGMLNGPFDFTFEFELPTLSAVDVKAMLTGKVEVDGQVFYVPLLPCVTDFAAVPAIEIPVSSTEENLLPAIIAALTQSGDLSCNNVTYDFTAPGADTCFGLPPTNGCTVNHIPGVACLGTEGNDVIVGNRSANVIVGRGGNDFVKARDGDDMVCGGTGDDLIEGAWAMI